MNNFIMMIGLPGVGKDYFIENTLKYTYPNAIILSSDDIREEVFNDVCYALCEPDIRYSTDKAGVN